MSKSKELQSKRIEAFQIRLHNDENPVDAWMDSAEDVGLSRPTRNTAYTALAGKRKKGPLKDPDFLSKKAEKDANPQTPSGTSIDGPRDPEPRAAKGSYETETREGRIIAYHKICDDPEARSSEIVAALKELGKIYGDQEAIEEEKARVPISAIAKYFVTARLNGKDPAKVFNEDKIKALDVLRELIDADELRAIPQGCLGHEHMMVVSRRAEALERKEGKEGKEGKTTKG